jgi:hypothetical protein
MGKYIAPCHLGGGLVPGCLIEGVIRPSQRRYVVAAKSWAPTSGAFTATTHSLYAHKESCWSSTLLPGHRLTSCLRVRAPLDQRPIDLTDRLPPLAGMAFSSCCGIHHPNSSLHFHDISDVERIEDNRSITCHLTVVASMSKSLIISWSCFRVSSRVLVITLPAAKGGVKCHRSTRYISLA